MRMSDTATQTARLTSLTGLLIPLSDRHLLLPNVAVAELIDYQDSVADPAAPQWYMGPINWRHRSLPLLSFEAACGGRARVGGRARIVVLNALGGRADLKFIALLTQGIPRSCKLDSQLSYVDVPLSDLELAAVQIGDTVAKVPDLVALEQWLVEAGLGPAGPSL
jgi:chemosensory pili system protein ChpC